MNGVESEAQILEYLTAKFLGRCLNLYGVYLHVFVRTILAVARGFEDLFDHIVAFDDFSEDGVFAGEPVVFATVRKN